MYCFCFLFSFVIYFIYYICHWALGASVFMYKSTVHRCLMYQSRIVSPNNEVRRGSILERSLTTCKRPNALYHNLKSSNITRCIVFQSRIYFPIIHSKLKRTMHLNCHISLTQKKQQQRIYYIDVLWMYTSYRRNTYVNSLNDYNLSGKTCSLYFIREWGIGGSCSPCVASR